LELFYFVGESIGTVEALEGLILAIADSFAKVKQALVLPDVFNVLLYEAQLVHAHFQIVQEICHLIVQKVQLVDILFVYVLASYATLSFICFFLAFCQYTLRLGYFCFKDRDVPFEHLYFKQALLSLIEVHIVIDFVARVLAHLAGRRELTPSINLLVATDR